MEARARTWSRSRMRKADKCPYWPASRPRTVTKRRTVTSRVHSCTAPSPPALTFEDGLEVVHLLMAAYKSAELGRTIPLPARGLESFKPLVAQGKWKPGKKIG